MDINWSAFDGLLGVLLVIVVIWVALKLVKRIVIGLIAVVLLAAIFFGMHFGDLPFGG
jgi:hypothetical protein